MTESLDQRILAALAAAPGNALAAAPGNALAAAPGNALAAAPAGVSAAAPDDASDDARFGAALAVVQQSFNAHMGTLHRLGADEHLHLVAASPGMPEPVLAASRRIPLGKGIAGEAAATAKPVSLCNLQTDTSGVARPGAKATGLGGSLCVPILDGTRVVGTLGIGWVGERTITDDETAALLAAARVLGPALGAAG